MRTIISERPTCDAAYVRDMRAFLAPYGLSYAQAFFIEVVNGWINPTDSSAYVAAVDALPQAWADQRELSFDGEFYYFFIDFDRWADIEGDGTQANNISKAIDRVLHALAIPPEQAMFLVDDETYSLPMSAELIRSYGDPWRYSVWNARAPYTPTFSYYTYPWDANTNYTVSNFVNYGQTGNGPATNAQRFAYCVQQFAAMSAQPVSPADTRLSGPSCYLTTPTQPLPNRTQGMNDAAWDIALSTCRFLIDWSPGSVASSDAFNYNKRCYGRWSLNTLTDKMGLAQQLLRVLSSGGRTPAQIRNALDNFKNQSFAKMTADNAFTCISGTTYVPASMGD